MEYGAVTNMDNVFNGIDVRTIPLSEFPIPTGNISQYVWEIEPNHLSLYLPNEDGLYHVTYDVPGGYISAYAEKEAVVFFVDAVRKLTAAHSAANTAPSDPPAEVSEPPV